MNARLKCPHCGSTLVEAALVLNRRPPSTGKPVTPGFLDCECGDCRETWHLHMTEGLARDVRMASGLEGLNFS